MICKVLAVPHEDFFVRLFYRYCGLFVLYALITVLLWIFGEHGSN